MPRYYAPLARDPRETASSEQTRGRLEIRYLARLLELRRRHWRIEKEAL